MQFIKCPRIRVIPLRQTLFTCTFVGKYNRKESQQLLLEKLKLQISSNNYSLILDGTKCPQLKYALATLDNGN